MNDLDQVIIEQHNLARRVEDAFGQCKLIEQHNLARRVEDAFGQCKLSIEMRRIADTLSTLNSPFKPSTAKGEQ